MDSDAEIAARVLSGLQMDATPFQLPAGTVLDDDEEDLRPAPAVGLLLEEDPPIQGGLRREEGESQPFAGWSSAPAARNPSQTSWGSTLFAALANSAGAKQTPESEDRPAIDRFFGNTKDSSGWSAFGPASKAKQSPPPEKAIVTPITVSTWQQPAKNQSPPEKEKIPEKKSLTPDAEPFVPQSVVRQVSPPIAPIKLSAHDVSFEPSKGPSTFTAPKEPTKPSKQLTATAAPFVLSPPQQFPLPIPGQQPFPLPIPGPPQLYPHMNHLGQQPLAAAAIYAAISASGTPVATPAAQQLSVHQHGITPLQPLATLPTMPAQHPPAVGPNKPRQLTANATAFVPGGQTGDPPQDTNPNRYMSEAEMFMSHLTLTMQTSEGISYNAIQYRDLLSQVRYIPLPDWLFETVGHNVLPSPDGLYGLFVGQSIYHMTPVALRYIFERVCGIDLLYVEVMWRQPSAFFYVYVRTAADQAKAIEQLHRRVLFDAHGMWVAKTEKENEALQEFVNRKRPLMYPLVSLPRKCFVVELRTAKKDKDKEKEDRMIAQMMAGIPPTAKQQQSMQSLNSVNLVNQMQQLLAQQQQQISQMMGISHQPQQH